jgi:hypothetical protein
VYYAKPTSSYGYYRGSPVFGGDTNPMGDGPNVSGANVFSAGQGTTDTAGGSNWSPTILYLFVLVLVEMFLFAFVARHL